MNADEIMRRILKITKSWDATFALMEEFPIDPVISSSPQLTLVQPEPPIKIETPQKKWLRPTTGRKGKVKNDVLDVLEVYPNSTIQEIMLFAGREIDDKAQRNSTATVCRRMHKEKYLIRKKDDTGQYRYSLKEANG